MCYVICMSYVLLLFFFFQAEDGIRDDLVTGVQTCALPIFPDRSDGGLGGSAASGKARRLRRSDHVVGSNRGQIPDDRMGRSEERRVGKECRSRWSPYH